MCLKLSGIAHFWVRSGLFVAVSGCRVTPLYAPMPVSASSVSPSNSRDCATSISFAVSLLALFLSYLSVVVLFDLNLFFSWPKCNVGNQSGLASSKYAGFPDMKCREQMRLFLRTRLSSRPSLHCGEKPSPPFFRQFILLLSLLVMILHSVERNICVTSRGLRTTYNIA